MNEYINKRNDLERFLEEQLIGPGILNRRFFFLQDYDKSDFSGKNIKLETNPSENGTEIITEVPAYIYGSGIIFPETRVSDRDMSDAFNEPEGTPISGDETDTENQGVDDDDLSGDNSESLVSKQQNYPTSIGISFVVDEGSMIERDFSVRLSYRKYENIKKEDAFTRRIACWVSEYDQEIESAISRYFQPLFATEIKDGNIFIFLCNKLTTENLYEIDYKLLNNYLLEHTIPLFQRVIKGRLGVVKEKDGRIFYGITDRNSCELFSITRSGKYGDNIVNIYSDNIVKFVKDELALDLDNYTHLKEIIQAVEVYNQLRRIVTDLKTIFKTKNASPVWQSKAYNDILLEMPTFLGSKNVSIKSGIAVNGEDELKYSVQYIKRNKEIFVKIAISNVGYIVLDRNEPMQLNKKDEANLKSFFGIKLHVKENKPETFRRYNPPQLLNFDEEDNFNKLLYRNFKDYGEGYNTSVDWGIHSDNLKYICTDFLPKQESPKIDFTPRMIQGKKVTARLKDEQVLSMRFLSTLSNVNNEHILEELAGFVSEYGIWVIEKRNSLESEDGLTQPQKDLLEKQLAACERDHKRLERNISLLGSDKEAMMAFRVMNTAMFMQLHHNRGIETAKKDGIGVYDSFENNADYYSSVECINVSDYRWRSFQIAFILLNIDAFVRHEVDERIVQDVFGTGWPERNEIADLVWFPTGGGKTEAYLGIIAFTISYRRFTKGAQSGGTTVLMRYTLRLLTLQQFQRATLLICALEVIRNKDFDPKRVFDLGTERISIGLFVGGGSLPNSWNDKHGMLEVINKIQSQIGNRSAENSGPLNTVLPFTECPWCGTELFQEYALNNVNHKKDVPYGIDGQLRICCNSRSCAFSGRGSSNRPGENESLPVRLFDDDIYKYPPTLLFGTVDKFAALANNVSRSTNGRNKDSRRLFGTGYKLSNLPPELIIQDELHLLLGPLGSAVGLYEKGVDVLCTYTQGGQKIRPKIITSTATTRNTDKQIFALFNRRSEIFPKQGTTCDDSFFAFYERNPENGQEYISNRKYVGILPVGKTQVWMQLRVASICLSHRLKYLTDRFTNDEIFIEKKIEAKTQLLDYYHTILSYFNSLKDVGKTQSQLSHYLPGDVNFVMNNTIPWSFVDKMLRTEGEIQYSELTGRLSGEEVKSNLSFISKNWSMFKKHNDRYKLTTDFPPEFVISTNMISVGVDISRFNTMIISSMPRNIAEYIQASSRVARNKEGIVFTVHHPFRSRDISHYQKFKEFHEKFYSYVEPISVTPFASKALDRYFAMLLAVMVRHSPSLDLADSGQASSISEDKVESIRNMMLSEISSVLNNANRLEDYLTTKKFGISTSIEGVISEYEVNELVTKLNQLVGSWLDRSKVSPGLEFRTKEPRNSLFTTNGQEVSSGYWKVNHSLREIDPSIIIKTVQQ
jgi:hypothetical protein